MLAMTKFRANRYMSSAIFSRSAPLFPWRISAIWSSMTSIWRGSIPVRLGMVSIIAARAEPIVQFLARGEFSFAICNVGRYTPRQPSMGTRPTRRFSNRASA
jgi:hypothetical protein